MFCFETAFKLLCLSWVAYVDDVTPAGCERECTLQRMQQLEDAAPANSPCWVCCDEAGTASATQGIPPAERYARTGTLPTFAKLDRTGTVLCEGDQDFTREGQH